MFTHPVVAGPILASHPLDVQDFVSPQKANLDETSAPVGCPSINIEAKLVGVSDDAVESGSVPLGTLLVRGPSVGKLLGLEDYVNVPSSEDEGWVGTGARAMVQTNGAFRVLTGSV
jgi:long-chain acyl-CoA synthetase